MEPFAFPENRISRKPVRRLFKTTEEQLVLFAGEKALFCWYGE